MEKEHSRTTSQKSSEMPSTGSKSMMPPAFGFQDGGQTVSQMKPSDEETGFPYDGEIVGASTVGFRSSPNRNPNDPYSNVVADLPKGTVVKVVGKSGGWLKVEWKGQIGYVSQELVKKAPSRPTVPPPNYFTYDAATPERILLKADCVTKAQIAKDLYGDAALAGFLHEVPAPKSPAGPDVELGKGTTLRIEFRYLKPELQRMYESTVDVTTREEWGAREPNTADTEDYHPYDKPLEDVYHSIALHISGHSNMHAPEEVESEHRDDNDWADIGYHYAIGLDGEVFEGRPIEVRGNHIEKGNTGVIGIVFLADLNTESPAEFPWIDPNGNDSLGKEMEASMLQLVHYLLGKYPNITKLGGHKEFNTQRSCPGDIPMGKMDGWRGSTGLQVPKAVN